MSRLIMVLALAAAACAAPAQQAPPAPAPTPTPTPTPAQQQAFDPVGTYDFSTQVQGMPVTGALTLRRADDGRITGVISTDMTGEMQLQSVTLEGRRAIMRSSTPDGELYMQVEFLQDDRITGGWELSTGPAGSIAGQRRRTGS
jgi:ABC-type transport system substrate-binding protein